MADRFNREFNRTRDDPCAQQQEINANSKKLKFVTTNHADLLNAKESNNFFGLAVRDELFVPSDKIDEYSQLRNGVAGNVMTNQNVKPELGPLPLPTMPARYQLAHGDVVVEDTLRSNYQVTSKSCNPKGDSFYNRTFYIFNDREGIETPNAEKSVEPNDMGPRGGKGTRF